MISQDQFQVKLRGTETTLEWIQEHLGQKEAWMVYIESFLRTFSMKESGKWGCEGGCGVKKKFIKDEVLELIETIQ